MKTTDIAKFEPQRRYATLVAMIVEGMASITDEVIELHDRIIGKFFSTAKHKHQQRFHQSGKAINNKVRLFGRIGQALVDAKQSGGDAFAAIESVLPGTLLCKPSAKRKSSRSLKSSTSCNW